MVFLKIVHNFLCTQNVTKSKDTQVASISFRGAEAPGLLTLEEALATRLLQPGPGPFHPPGAQQPASLAAPFIKVRGFLVFGCIFSKQRKFPFSI